MKSKEKVYDEEIAPLMAKIIEISKNHEIPMFAEFQYEDEGFVTTYIKHDGHSVLDYMQALAQCIEPSGVNMDKFLFGLMKSYPNQSSVCMMQLGSKPQTP